MRTDAKLMRGLGIGTATLFLAVGAVFAADGLTSSAPGDPTIGEPRATETAEPAETAEPTATSEATQTAEPTQTDRAGRDRRAHR